MSEFNPKKQQLKHLLTEFVENQQEYMNEFQIKRFGKKSRYNTLSHIHQMTKIGSRGFIIVKAELDGEWGTLKLIIPMKQFQNRKDALRNKVLMDQLVLRLQEADVKTPRVITVSESTLIFEGIQGETYNDSDILQGLKTRLIGEALAKYHTAELQEIDINRYNEQLKKSLKTLDLPTEEEMELDKRAHNLLNEISKCSSGCVKFGAFHHSRVLFTQEHEETGKRTVKTWLIEPENVETEVISDRMKDISHFFLDSALEHFGEKGNLQGFRDQLMPFFQGYANYLNKFNLSLNKIYQTYVEASFVFHLGLNSLLKAVQQRQKGMTGEHRNQMATTVNLTRHCWKQGLN